MRNFLIRLLAVKLTLALLLSTLPGQLARAHEVSATVADFAVEDGRLTFELRMNVEAFIAGVDLDTVVDTNDSDRSDQYDALRLLAPDVFAPQIEDWAAAWLNGSFMATTRDAPLTLVLDAVRVEPVGNAELPRETALVLSAALPESARAITVVWPDGAGALVLRQFGVDDPYTGYIEGGTDSGPINLAGGNTMSASEAFWSYVPVGFDHIIPKGLDHILFVLGLFFFSTRMGPLIWQVSAFTVAHTITLALAALDLVRVPGEIVEPLIAASIVFVAVENIWAAGRFSRLRPVVIFGFGLLHGLGFASVLADFGLPSNQFVPALIGFNVGVEVGQLAVIAVAFLLTAYWFGNRAWYRAMISMPASVLIAAVGAYWFVERVFL